MIRLLSLTAMFLDRLYLQLPLISSQTGKLKCEVLTLVNKFFPQTDSKSYFRTILGQWVPSSILNIESACFLDHTRLTNTSVTVANGVTLG